MAALSRRNFDYTSAEIEVSKVRGSGCDIRCSSFEIRGSSRFKFQVSGFDSGCDIRGSCCESRFTSYTSRVTKTHKKKEQKTPFSLLYAN